MADMYCVLMVKLVYFLLVQYNLFVANAYISSITSFPLSISDTITKEFYVAMPFQRINRDKLVYLRAFVHKCTQRRGKDPICG